MTEGPRSSSHSISLLMPTRIRLHHAALQGLADSLGIRILHVKGHAAPAGMYREQRTPSDADVLVEPDRVDDFLAALAAAGWDVNTTFETGSPYRHAAVLTHSELGYADVHRLFPGTHLGPAELFEACWSRHITREIAHVPCTVPSDLDHAALVIINAARDLSRKDRDIAHLESWAGEERWAHMLHRCREWGAETAADIALGRTVTSYRYADDALLTGEGAGQDRLTRWLARWRAEATLRGKVRVLVRSLRINRDHLRMNLGHEPSAAEVRAAHRARLQQLSQAAWGRLRPPSGGDAA